MSTDADTEQKLSVAKQKKEVADQAFKAGEVVNGMARRRASGRCSTVWTVGLIPFFQLLGRTMR